MLPDGVRRYRQSLPLSAFAWIALTAFPTFASVGLVANLVDGLQWPFGWVLVKAAFFGAITALSFAIILRNRKARFPDPHTCACSPGRFAAVRQFGRQTDDETLVLVRVGQFGSDF